MKTFRNILIAFLFIALPAVSQAQKGVEDGSKYGHGEDSINCIRNLSLYREYAKHENYKDALNPWRRVYNECPLATENIYIDGVKIFRDRIEKATDDAVKDKLIDTLMMIYDQRIKYYDDRGNVLGRKGVDWLRYKRSSQEDIKTGYDILGESMSILKTKTPAAVLATYFTASVTLFKYNALDATQVLDDYTEIMNNIDGALAQKPDNNMYKEVKEVIDQNFATSGAATCDNLIGLFEPKFQQTPEDIDLLKKITTYLDRSGCQESDLFIQASEKLYELEPNPQSAYNLAKLFLKKQDYKKSSFYYLKAVQADVDPATKAEYYYELALVTSRLNDKVQARNYALKAIDLNPKFGDAYILIGNLYAGSSTDCGDNEFAQKAVFWAAVDKYMKAKEVDPSVADQANELIGRYSQYFPNNENAFFYGFTDGQTYTVGCWINEKTTVRTIKK